MIRYIDLVEELGEDGYKFAWFNTIICEFEMHSGSMAWEDWKEFEEDYRGDELERYKRLFFS